MTSFRVTFRDLFTLPLLFLPPLIVAVISLHRFRSTSKDVGGRNEERQEAVLGSIGNRVERPEIGSGGGGNFPRWNGYWGPISNLGSFLYIRRYLSTNSLR